LTRTLKRHGLGVGAAKVAAAAAAAATVAVAAVVKGGIGVAFCSACLQPLP
jgi:hypothetical protein